MSFFGFQQQGRGHPTQAPGFGTAPDPFASISQNRHDEGDAIDFDDTYDGLGDQLDEADDDFNDDTFGGGGEPTAKAPGKDYDFFGNTSKASDAINEEAVRFNRQQPSSKPLVSSSGPLKQTGKSYKTGYKAYKNPTYISDFQVDASLWGEGPAKAAKPPVAQQIGAGYGTGPSQQRTSSAAPAKKMMSLEEVEAAMAAQAKKPSPSSVARESYQAPSYPMPPVQPQVAQHVQSRQGQMSQAQDPRFLQHQASQSPAPQEMPAPQMREQQRPSAQPTRHAQRPSQGSTSGLQVREPPAPQAPQVPQILHRAQQSIHYAPDARTSPQPVQVLQNPNRHSAQLAARSQEMPAPEQPQPRMIMTQQKGAQVSLPIITHPSQLAQLTDEQRQAFLIEDAKRAKRNHKIYLLSKDNGLMTPQDKNFITRIQLQQLMTATGNVNEQDPDASLSEDFYYQVYNQIENRPRQNPHQPLSNFAQTYLFQTGGRQGGMGRRQNRGGANHMHRMQQQVQRAVEAAKLKPKNKQLVIDGSLGKISFSNAKTPKPLLNIRRQEKKLPQATLSTTDRKAILKNIEAVYSSLMKIEDHDRRIPPQPADETDEAALHLFLEWRQTFQALNQRLWSDLKVLEPIMPESALLHPFIAFLSYPKGKKAIPRIFSHIDQEQRLTILTIIMIQLDTLDVIRSNQPQFAASQSAITAREQVDLFLQTVMPSLFSYVTEAPLHIIIGLVEIIIERLNIHAIMRTQVGLEMLTMLLSQAEIIRKAENTNEQEWEQWLGIYNRLFDLVEPMLADTFPGPVSAGQDVYVWQFLATMGTGANPEQQQRLVLAVKDRVMETVQQSKTLPPEMATRRRGNVNLFMQAIGLDVDLLDS